MAKHLDGTTPSADAEGRPPVLPEWLASMNKRHAVVWLNGKARVLWTEYDPVHGREAHRFASFQDSRDYYSNQYVDAGDDRDKIPLGQAWLAHPRRRQYRAVRFEPEGMVPEGTLNLWTGFACEPKRGSWERLQEHILTNICQCDPGLFRYVVQWMATGVQHPGRPAEVALVLRGRQGTGKGIFGRGYGSLFGRHFMHISSLRHLVGTFNAHFLDTVVLFADEVFCNGSRDGVGELKRLVTEPTLTIEAKYRDALQVRNMLHVIVASNESWIIPAGPFERRFCVLDIGHEHMQDRDYFRAILHEQDHGGREAMLYDLQHEDLAGFDARDVPRTKALREQQVLSLPAGAQWWRSKLAEGRVLDQHDGWQCSIPRDQLHQDFARAMNEAREPTHGRSAETALGQLLHELLPGHKLADRHRVGGRLTKFYRLPALDVARSLFDAARGPQDWPAV